MLILVANIGSTSFKFRLFDMSKGEKEMVRGGAERIGLDDASVKVGDQQWTGRLANHGDAIEKCLALLPDPHVRLDAIGFKPYSGARIIVGQGRKRERLQRNGAASGAKMSL